MTARVVLATRNAGKIAELRVILAEANFDGELVGVDEFPDVEDVAETGDSFAANALLKAHAVSAATGLPAIADDSGLAVDALNGMPGIFSARWAGRHGDDDANLQLLLAQLHDVPDEGEGQPSSAPPPTSSRVSRSCTTRRCAAGSSAARAARTGSATTPSSSSATVRGPPPRCRPTRRTP